MLRLDDFNYELPQELIALRPCAPRDFSRLLVVDPQENGIIADTIFRELPKYLRKGDVLVFNNSKTIPASLNAIRPPRDEKSPEVKVQVNLHKKQSDGVWFAFVKPAKRLVLNDVLHFSQTLNAKVIVKNEGGEVLLDFNLKADDFNEALKQIGHMPIPPYIGQKRQVDEKDNEDYQTIYAAPEGSVATPTAGLHFTKELFETLDKIGVERHFVTLHVGAGTFLPVKVDNLSEHKMHSEYCELSHDIADALNKAKQENRRIICVGTTSLRTLESAADENGIIHPFFDETSIFIYPGKRIKFVDGLISNFHLPKSTLLMLLCAFSGTEIVKNAYRYAVENKFRFFSYGDAGLWWRKV